MEIRHLLPQLPQNLVSTARETHRDRGSSAPLRPAFVDGLRPVAALRVRGCLPWSDGPVPAVWSVWFDVWIQGHHNGAVCPPFWLWIEVTHFCW